MIRARRLNPGLLQPLSASLALGNAFPFSGHLSRVSERHRVPHYAILATVGPVVLLGILLLAAQTAYNAIVSTALIFSYLSMAIPVSCLLVRRRRFHESRWLKLGWVGWVVNVVAVGQAFLLSIMWLFPLQPDTDAGNMSEWPSLAAP